MFRKLLHVLLGIAVFMTPLFVYAAPATFSDFADIVVRIVINNGVIPFIFALALIAFLWGVVQYVLIDSDDAKTKGRDFIVWGLIGMAVMVSVWGLVNIVVNTFFVQSCLDNPNQWGCYGP